MPQAFVHARSHARMQRPRVSLVSDVQSWFLYRNVEHLTGLEHAVEKRLVGKACEFQKVDPLHVHLPRATGRRGTK